MKRIIFTIFTIMFFPGIVYADNISLNCPSEVTKGTEYTCTLHGYTDNGVFSLSSRVIVSGNVELIGFVTNRDLWQGDGTNGDIQLYREDDALGSFLIGTIKAKSNSDSDNIVTVENITFFSSSGDKSSINPISRIIKVKDNIAPTTTRTPQTTTQKPQPTTRKNDPTNKTTTKKNETTTTTTKPTTTKKSDDKVKLYLNDIIVEGYELNFYLDTYDYELKIDSNVDELVITPIVEDKSIKYQVFGNNNLSNESVIRIELSDDNDNTGEYRIKIFKDDTTTNKKNYSLVFIIIIGVLIITNIFRLLFSKRKGSVSE